MSEKCPECNSDLIELYTVESHVSTGAYDWVGSYDSRELYGYWCPYHEKMHVKKHKTWIEPWTYDSLSETVKEEGKE